MKGIKERENGVGRGVIGALRGRSAAHIGGTTNRLGLALLVVVLCVYFDTNSSNFLAGGNIIAILVAVSSTLLAAMAAGRLLVAGNVDLSIGGQYALLNVVCALVARSTDSLPLAALVALGGGVVLGAVNGYLVRILRISPIIVTLGLASVYTGFAYAASNDQSVYPVPNSLITFSDSKIIGIPDTVWIPVIVFVIGAFALDADRQRPAQLRDRRRPRRQQTGWPESRSARVQAVCLHGRLDGLGRPSVRRAARRRIGDRRPELRAAGAHRSRARRGRILRRHRTAR